MNVILYDNPEFAEKKEKLLKKISKYKFKTDELKTVMAQQFTYDEYVAYLLQKYGQVPGDYVIKSASGIGYSKNTSITRKGLEIHHIFENIQAELSNEFFWGVQEWQAADVLVYANYIEHAILHYLITKEQPHSGLGWGGLFNHQMFKRTQSLLKGEDYQYFGYLIAIINEKLYEKAFAVLKNQTPDITPPSVIVHEKLLRLYCRLAWQYPYGITSITLDEYAAMGFKTGKLTKIKEILVLRSQQDHFMFIAKKEDNRLQLCNGGAVKNLKHTDPYWYLYRMDRYGQTCNEFWNKYADFVQPIVDFVQSQGGSGHLHGNIIDIDYFNHIKIDVNNQRVLPYFAPSVSVRTIYPSVTQLLIDLSKQKDMLPSGNHAELKPILQEADLDHKLLQIEQKYAITGLTTPICEDSYEDASKGFYSLNTTMRRIQKSITTKIITSWEARFEEEEVWKTAFAQVQ